MYTIQFMDPVKNEWVDSTCWANGRLDEAEAKKIVDNYSAMSKLQYRYVKLEAPAAPETVKLVKQVHYTALNPEPIDVIKAWNLNYNKGNVLKYISRAGRKDPSVEGTIKDLEKAISYLRREINDLKGTPGWE